MDTGVANPPNSFAGQTLPAFIRSGASTVSFSHRFYVIDGRSTQPSHTTSRLSDIPRGQTSTCNANNFCECGGLSH